MINLFFIKTFVAVADTGSFRLAAQKNNITQPAVSQHIRTLERRLNCVLLERSATKTTLTPAGLAFLADAKQMLELYQNAKAKIATAAADLTGTIHIASIYSMGLYQLKPVMQLLLKKYPSINTHLEYRPHNIIYDMVKGGAVDFGLVAFPKKIPGCAVEVFAEENLVCVQSRKHVSLPKKNIHLKDLEGIKFVTLELNTPTGEAIHKFFKSEDVRLNIVKEYDNIETIKSAIEVGVGCSILPKATVIQELKDKRFDLINVKGLTIKRPLALVRNSNKTLTRPAEIFREILLAQY